MVDRELSYEEQLRKAVSKTKQKTAWVLRTFSTREVSFLRIMWRTLIQCHLDYGCILWAPYHTKYKWKLMESPQREFTRRGKAMSGLNYWERLKAFNLSSIQRRVERYRIIYSWKSLNGLGSEVEQQGSVWEERSGIGDT